MIRYILLPDIDNESENQGKAKIFQNTEFFDNKSIYLF